MKKLCFIILFILCNFNILRAEGFYIDGGISLNMSNYGQPMDKFIDNYFSFYGLNRVVFGATVTSGYRIINGLYIVGTVIYTRDIIRGFGYQINLRSPALLAGVRWYPLKSHRFFQIGFDLGPSWLFFQNNIPGISDNSGIGLGINTTVAIDFHHNYDAPPFLFGGNVLYSYINGGSVITPGIFAKIIYKKTKNAGGEDFDTGDASIAAGIIWPVFGVIATWIAYNMIPSSGRSVEAGR